MSINWLTVLSLIAAGVTPSGWNTPSQSMITDRASAFSATVSPTA